MRKRKKSVITKKEMKAAIERSGYLFESEISRKLGQKGYFVENSTLFFDDETSVPREIDLVVEKYIPRTESDFIRVCYENHISVHSNYVLELKNNNFPLVLMTEEQFSPHNASFEGLRIVDSFPYSKYASILHDHPELLFDSYDGFFTELFNTNDDPIFTQYCSFERKKQNDELMALHPEVLHTSLRKICMYCDNNVDKNNAYFSNEKDDWIRHHIYIPILLIRNNLYQLVVNNNKNKLTKVECAVLKQNYYFKGEPQSTFVFVLTEKSFFTFLERMHNIEASIRRKILQLKQKSSSALL